MFNTTIHNFIIDVINVYSLFLITKWCNACRNKLKELDFENIHLCELIDYVD